MKTHSAVSILGLTLLLAACGGGGSGSYDPPVIANDPLKDVPASASQSEAGLLSYLNLLSTLAADDRDPLAVDTFSPTQSEETEPGPLGA